MNVLRSLATVATATSGDAIRTSICVTVGEFNARDIQGSVLAGAIYADTVQITNHINNIGGISTIEFIPAEKLEVPTIKLTQETQEYVRAIANEVYAGDRTEITGFVTRLLPDRLVAQIRTTSGRQVKVGLNPKDFQFVRYNTEPQQALRFRGVPIFRLGKGEGTYQEFDADSVQPVEA